MKYPYSLLGLLLLFTDFLQAQDSNFHRNWELKDVYFEQGNPLFIEDIEPAIHPYVIFYEDQTFLGKGACTNFSGTAEFTENNGIHFVQFSNVNFPVVDCENPDLNNIDYFLRNIFQNNINLACGTNLNPESGIMEFGIANGFEGHIRYESLVDSKLYNTWYLHEIQMDMAPTIYVENISPTINPSLILKQDYTYEGQMACNSFTGTFETNLDDLNFTEFNTTVLNCENQELSDFENIYAYLFTGEVHLEPWLWYNTQNGQLELWFGSSTSISYRFLQTTAYMGIQETEYLTVRIYPNPAANWIGVENGKANGSFQIYNLEGKLIQQGNLDFNHRIDVSVLPKGRYILKTHEQTIKFIKK